MATGDLTSHFLTILLSLGWHDHVSHFPKLFVYQNEALYSRHILVLEDDVRKYFPGSEKWGYQAATNTSVLGNMLWRASQVLVANTKSDGGSKHPVGINEQDPALGTEFDMSPDVS